jgi:hypothetical protein
MLPSEINRLLYRGFGLGQLLLLVHEGRVWRLIRVAMQEYIPIVVPLFTELTLYNLDV